jgi:MraZ protein
MAVRSGGKWGEVGISPKPESQMSDTAAKLTVFAGEFRHTMDNKHRVTIPARWRSGGKKDEFYLKVSPNKDFISVLPPTEIEKMHHKLNNDSRISENDKRKFARAYFSKMQTCAIDGQGRLLVPDDFCQAVGLGDELLLVGAFDRFEIWNPERWEKNQEDDEASVQQLSKLLGA